MQNPPVADLKVDDPRGADGKASATPAASFISIQQTVAENRQNVIGIQGDILGGNVYQSQVQVYHLSDAGRDGAWERLLEQNTPPYKFLSPYTIRDRPLFAGRDQETAQLVRRIGEQRLVVVYGAAGMGKTSLLAAGVIPALMTAGALVLHLHDYNQPAAAIRAALVGTGEQLTLPAETASLPELITSVCAQLKGSLVLVCDQMERLFEPQFDGTQRQSFLDGLDASLQAVEPNLLRVIVCARDEVLGQLGALQERESFTDLLRAPVQLAALSQAEARAAIEHPLNALPNPISFGQDFVERQLVPDLDELSADMPGIIPSQLQIVCFRLFQAASERSTSGSLALRIDTEVYLKEGGADGIMANHLRDALATRLAGDQSRALSLLGKMSLPGAGAWVPRAQLVPAGSDAASTGSLLDRLVDAGFLAVQYAGLNDDGSYAFANPVVAEQVRRMAGPEVEKRFAAEAEIERLWSEWLVRPDYLVDRDRLRFLLQLGADQEPLALKSDPIRALLLVASAVAADEPTRPWVEQFHGQAAHLLIRQLEEPDREKSTEYSGLLALERASRLLGLPPRTVPEQDRPPADSESAEAPSYGPVARSAVTSPQAATRQAAALALTALGHEQATSRLESALTHCLKYRQRQERRAELWGSMADAIPEMAIEIALLSYWDRARIWRWRAIREIVRIRERLIALTLGGAVGAGVALACVRAIIALLIGDRAGLMFGLNFYFAAMLGGALSLGFAAASPLTLASAQNPPADQPTGAIGAAPGRTNSRFRRWRTTLLAILLGGFGFGLAHMVLIWFNGLSLTYWLTIVLGLLAGLVLSAAIAHYPKSSGRRGRRMLSVVGAALAFGLIQCVFVVAGSWGTSLMISLGGSHYQSQLFWTVKRWWPDLGATFPHWPDLLAVFDAAIVGVVLVLGITTGHRIASRWLQRHLSLTGLPRSATDDGSSPIQVAGTG